MGRQLDPNRTWGIPESQLYKVKVDNGCKVRNDWWTHWFKTDGDKQVCGAYVCGGKTPGSKYPQNLGRRCPNPGKLRPSGRCRRHSGGTVSAPITHGKYMQLRGPLKEATERAHAHRALLDLRPLIALFDLRVEELSSRMDAHAAGPEEWRLARVHWQEFRKGQKNDDKNQMDHHAKELSLLFDKAHRTEKTWVEMLSIAERRLKRTEKAQALLIASANMVAAQDLKWLMARLTGIITQEAHGTASTRILDRIAKECLSRISPGGGEENEIEARGELLPRVPGTGVRVLPRDPGGEVLGRTTSDLRGLVPTSLDGSEDVPRAGEDEGGSGDTDDVSLHEEGRDSGVDGTNGPSGEEPPVGGSGGTARPRRRPRK